MKQTHSESHQEDECVSIRNGPVQLLKSASLYQAEDGWIKEACIWSSQEWSEGAKLGYFKKLSCLFRTL